VTEKIAGPRVGQKGLPLDLEDALKIRHVKSPNRDFILGCQIRSKCGATGRCPALFV
jgi:hypothetical protein